MYFPMKTGRTHLSEKTFDFWQDMTPEEAWEYLEGNLRQDLGRELDHLRKEQAMSQAALAEKIQATQPMLSRFFKGDDDRSPTLETLVKLAWGLNRYVEVNFVSDLPSRSVVLPPESDPSLWPGAATAIAQGSASAQLQWVRVQKLMVESGQIPDEKSIPFIKCECTMESMLAEDEQFTPQQGRPPAFYVQLPVVTRVMSENKGGAPWLVVNATMRAAYQVNGAVPRQVLEDLMRAASEQALEQLWGRYRETLKVVALRAGMPLSVIDRIQAFHVRSPIGPSGAGS